MNCARYLFVISLLLLLILFLPAANAKHIIVIYDVSGSMHRHKGRTVMKSEDMRRVNDYLTGILFSDTSQKISGRDSLTKACDPPYAGKPLYQEGDFLTYCAYAVNRKCTKKQKGMSRHEFQQLLPDPFFCKFRSVNPVGVAE